MSSEFPEDVRPKWPSEQQINHDTGLPPQRESARPQDSGRAMDPPQGIGRPVVRAQGPIIGDMPAWLAAKQQAEMQAAQGEEGLLGFEPTGDKENEKGSRVAKVVITLFAAGLALAGAGGADAYFYKGEHVDKVFDKLMSKLPAGSSTNIQHSLPVTPKTPVSTPTTAPTTHAPTKKPTKSPTTAAKKVLPATALACAQALPTDIKIGQLVEPAIDANSNMAEVKALSLKYHLGSWLILKYPVQSDGKTPNIDAVMDLRKIDKDVPTYMTIDGEGGAINRLPGATVPPGPDKVSTTKPAPAVFQKQLETYYAQLKAAGIDVNLAPVVDIQGFSKEKTDGRLFRTTADVAKYMPSYIAAAKNMGIILTDKHGFDVLPYGNTDVKPVVTTPSYDALLKSGALDIYKLAKGTNNWVMMGHAKTAGYPNKAIDNKQIASLNPAAYDAMHKLAGDPLMITDALNAKAVNTVMPQADAAAEAIVDGADIAMIVPRAGYTTTDTKATLAAIEKTVSPERIDAAFLKVLAAKSINACTLLAAKDSSYLAPKPAAKTNPAPATTSSSKPTVSPTSPAKVAVTAKPTATAVSKQTVIVKNKAVATASATK